jgi:hypothetical protein
MSEENKNIFENSLDCRILLKVTQKAWSNLTFTLFGSSSTVKNLRGLLMCALQRQNTGNSKPIFPDKELRGHSPIPTFMFL